MNYRILWTDFHSNIHHEAMDKLDIWTSHMQEILDFWPIAYYPYYLRKDQSGLGVEDIHDQSIIETDWKRMVTFVRNQEPSDFPVFLGYEWQGSGLDGDHNVFFKEDSHKPVFPLRYVDLVTEFKNREVIGIPHHLAYQTGHRGKNWETQNNTFSPFAEIYSSHGSSENDDSPIGMDRHIHMGPRSDGNSVESGLNSGARIGIIAAGDNHSVPGVFGFGYAAVLATDNSKDAIWDALIHRRVYGVSHNKIKLDFSIDGNPMGSIMDSSESAELVLSVEAGSAIDRIEILKDNIVTEMIPHTSTYEKDSLGDRVRFKFKIDFGWGPDRRIFPDIDKRSWVGSIKTPGSLISVEKCWSNFGQEITYKDNHSMDFNLTTYKTTASGKWMGPSAVTPEGFIIEIEDRLDSSVHLIVENMEYNFEIKSLLENSRVIPLYEEAEKLLKDRFGFESYYRSDPWWHNAYKIKLSKASPNIAYQRTIHRNLDLSDCNQIRVRVWQKDGACAWSSPIFIDHSEENDV